jgi:hypothetical protein
MPLDHLGDAITFGALVIGHIVWLIRLEGKTNYNERAIEKLEVKHDALDNKIVEKLSVIEKSLAKIEGRLSIEAEER